MAPVRTIVSARAVNAPVDVVAVPTVPSVKSPLPAPFVIETALGPLLLRVTRSLKSLFEVKVIAAAPAVNLAVPPIINAPDWVIAPGPPPTVESAIKFPPTLPVPKFNAPFEFAVRPPVPPVPIVTVPSVSVFLSLIATSLVSLFVSVTAPTKSLLAWVSVIALLEAEIVEMPVTVKAPL